MDDNQVNAYQHKDERTFGQKTKSFFNNISSVRQILLWYLIISLTGALLLWLPFTHTSDFNSLNGEFGLSFIDALFVSSSAFSDTGLSTVGISDTFNIFGQAVTLVLLQIGGIGWFTIKIFIITFILRKATNYNTIADGSSELGTNRKNDTLGLVFFAVVISFGASLIFGFIFSLIFYFTEVEGVDTIWQAIWTGYYHASASVNNSGLDIFVGNDSMSTMYGANSGSKVGWEVTIEVLTLSLFVLGGIGFGIMFDIYRYFKSIGSGERFTFSLVTKICVVTYVAVAFAGLGLTYISEGLSVIGDSENAFLSSDWEGATQLGLLDFEIDFNALIEMIVAGDITGLQEALENAISAAQTVDHTFENTSVAFRWWTLTFNTFSTRNAGFATMNLAYLHDATKLIFATMMFIGSGPGSTAGGLRTTTFAVIIVTLWASGRNKPQPHAFNKGIPVEVSRKAFAILCFSLAILFTDIVAITIIEVSFHEGNEFNGFIDNMFVVFSAYGTTGLAIADLGTYHWLSKLILILLMFIGQMGISNTLNQVSTKQIKHQRQYVEEYINLG